MKKITAIIFAFCLCFMVTLSAWASEEDPVKSFVSRLYTEVLDREGDPAGLDAWTEVLKSGQEQGAKVAQGFIESQEFLARNLSNEQYVTVLYHTFFDREPDPAGHEAWIGVLESGMSRTHVLKGFAESAEFTEVCERYGIERGTITLSEPRDLNEGITKFIIRCYNLCLGRDADAGGLNNWCDAILSGRNTAKEAAYGFVFSPEFLEKNLSDEEYVRILYRVFMDRDADGPGLEAWLGVLAEGKSRHHVFNGFADSQEFAEVCANYGIEPGPSIPEPEPEPEVYKGIGTWDGLTYTSEKAGMKLRLPYNWAILEGPYDYGNGETSEFTIYNASTGEDMVMLGTYYSPDNGYGDEFVKECVYAMMYSYWESGLTIDYNVYAQMMGGYMFYYCMATDEYGTYYVAMIRQLNDGTLLLLSTISNDRDFLGRLNFYLS